MAIVVYNGEVTAGGTDGNQVTQGNPIYIGANRGTISEPVRIALRATGDHHYLCHVAPKGTDTGYIQLSADGASWTESVFFSQIGTINSLIYLRAGAGEEEDYGVYSTVSLQMEYYQPV